MSERELILQELDRLEATAELMINNCHVIRAKLQPVSTGRSKKNQGLSEQQKADLLMKKRNRRKR